jgi:hypothetical protein
MTKT